MFTSVENIVTSLNAAYTEYSATPEKLKLSKTEWNLVVRDLHVTYNHTVPLGDRHVIFHMDWGAIRIYHDRVKVSYGRYA